MDILKYIGSFVCHQMAEKTFQVGGQFLPLCARCTGIYSGFLLGIIYQIVTRTRKRDQLPSWKILTTSVIFIILLIIESPISHFGWERGDNYLRLLLGLLCGLSISILSLPLFNRFLRRNTFDKSIITGWFMYLSMLLTLAFLFGLYFVPNVYIFRFLSFFSITGLLLVYLILNGTIGAILLSYKQRKPNLTNKSLVALLTLFLIMGEMWLLKIAHS